MFPDVQGSEGPRGKSHIKTRRGVGWGRGLLFVSQLIWYLLGIKMNQSHVNKTRFLYLSNIYEDDLVIRGFSRKGARKIGVESERGADWRGCGPHPGPLAGSFAFDNKCRIFISVHCLM